MPVQSPIMFPPMAEILDVNACRSLGSPTLASPIALDSYTAVLTAGHTVVAGDTLCVKEGRHFIQTEVLNVATNTLTCDRPFDSAFTTAAILSRSNVHLNVDGSVTPVIFRVSPAGLTVNFDITGITFSIEDDVAMDTSKFGGIAALTRGIVVRKKDGVYKSIFNAKSNDDFAHHCVDVIYTDKAPAGQYGLRAVKHFSGREYHDTMITLNYATADELQIIVQDNLTGLLGFEVLVKGRVRG